MSYTEDTYTATTATKVQARDILPGDVIVPLRGSGPGDGAPVYGVERDGHSIVIAFGRPTRDGEMRTAPHQTRNFRDDLYIFRPKQK